MVDYFDDVGEGNFDDVAVGALILTLGLVSACVIFMLRTMPRTRVPSAVTISMLSLV
jgi:hypothetical protein